ncbi:MAG: hypothetical protein LYZ69_00925 [Nitrososphaerales archaeon]|nr:hypothetical protein [Nitrososphaerales archaeon]
MPDREEHRTASRLLGVSLPAERARLTSSRLEKLEDGYTEHCKWETSRRWFGRVLERADSECGDEGAKFCLVHFFLDALHHSPAGVEASARGSMRVGGFACHALPGDARLELLLMVQKDFPKYLEVAEELGRAIRSKEEEIVNLAGRRSIHESVAVRPQQVES